MGELSKRLKNIYRNLAAFSEITQRKLILKLSLDRLSKKSSTGFHQQILRPVSLLQETLERNSQAYKDLEEALTFMNKNGRKVQNLFFRAESLAKTRGSKGLYADAISLWEALGKVEPLLRNDGFFGRNKIYRINRNLLEALKAKNLEGIKSSLAEEISLLQNLDPILLKILPKAVHLEDYSPHIPAKVRGKIRQFFGRASPALLRLVGCIMISLLVMQAQPIHAEDAAVASGAAAASAGTPLPPGSAFENAKKILLEAFKKNDLPLGQKNARKIFEFSFKGQKHYLIFTTAPNPTMALRGAKAWVEQRIEKDGTSMKVSPVFTATAPDGTELNFGVVSPY
ncbi:hypothetical protein HYU14_00825 [Candidatus Woesearchaeota archaeon]|nr:hypothetical protein [Candidatus Woesearchaeota archaeon]